MLLHKIRKLRWIFFSKREQSDAEFAGNRLLGLLGASALPQELGVMAPT